MTLWQEFSSSIVRIYSKDWYMIQFHSLVLIWQNVLFFSLHPLLLLSVVLPRQSGTVCLAMFSSVDIVCVADAACSLLWGEDIIWSMPGSHLVVLPSGETANRASIIKLSQWQKDQSILVFFCFCFKKDEKFYSNLDWLKITLCCTEL